MNDYYKVLDLKYNYTALVLFIKYLEKAKVALTNNNKEEFTKIRMGFEVLRDENVIDDYNRIYRKYILDQELNFPQSREEQMIQKFKAKEIIGERIANDVFAVQESYLTHFVNSY